MRAVCTGAVCGGAQERELAAQYRGWAEAMAYTHPRVAVILRGVEKAYLSEAVGRTTTRKSRGESDISGIGFGRSRFTIPHHADDDHHLNSCRYAHALASLPHTPPAGRVMWRAAALARPLSKAASPLTATFGRANWAYLHAAGNPNSVSNHASVLGLAKTISL